MSAKERFLKYVTIDTQSDPESTSYPSTAKQYNLLNLLKDELVELGLTDAAVDKWGYLTATLPARGCKDKPVYALLAHVDTAPDCSGTNVKPKEIAYNGGDIVLNKELDIVMRTSEFEFLESFKGKHLIVTDGTTLLGGDDKAGVAEIMGLLELYKNDESLAHPTLRIAFTPDEEIGAGTDHFDVKAFGADFGYTVDGGFLGELEYENFNAAGALVKVHGISIHTGSAKNKMINAATVAMEFQALLPENEKPEHTEGYEGFYHLNEINGGVEYTEMKYLLRDHNLEKLQQKKQYMQRIADFLNVKYGAGTVECLIKDSYFNMKEQLKPYMFLIDNAVNAMKTCGVTPIIQAIRGGTDGARLSWEGMPCPNLCTGTANMHGRYEFVCVEDMETIVGILRELMLFAIK